MPADSWRLTPGINHVGAYQVSGRPFAKAAIDCRSATKVEFKGVSRWIYVQNQGATELKVGFSENGISGSNYFTVNPQSGTLGPVELKCSEVWVWAPGAAAAKVNVLAGVTLIAPERCSGSAGPSFSGSTGVG